MAAIPQTYTLCGKVKSGLYHFMIQTTFAFYNGPPGDSCALMLDRGQVHHGPPRSTHSIGDISTENSSNEIEYEQFYQNQTNSEKTPPWRGKPVTAPVATLYGNRMVQSIIRNTNFSGYPVFTALLVLIVVKQPVAKLDLLTNPIVTVIPWYPRQEKRRPMASIYVPNHAFEV